jgi:hypothetical protein
MNKVTKTLTNTLKPSGYYVLYALTLTEICTSLSVDTRVLRDSGNKE